MVSSRGLREEHRGDAGQGTGADTSNDARDQNEVGGLGSRLQGTTDESKDCSDEETCQKGQRMAYDSIDGKENCQIARGNSPIDTSNTVSEPTASEATKDTAEIVDGDDTTLVEGVGNLAVDVADSDLNDV